MRLTVGRLRELIKDISDDTIIVGNECDHSYRQLYYADHVTVLDDGDGQYTQDIFVGELGEETEYGVRIQALIIE